MLTNHLPSLRKMLKILEDFNREPLVIIELSWLLINTCYFQEIEANNFFDVECDISYSATMCIQHCGQEITKIYKAIQKESAATPTLEEINNLKIAQSYIKIVENCIWLLGNMTSNCF